MKIELAELDTLVVCGKFLGIAEELNLVKTE